MNERIKELYTEASEQFKIVQDQGLPMPYRTRAFADKFSQLIIKECAKVIDNADSEGRLDDFAMVYLGEYFGIEE
jgi:hypothetical protein